MSPARILYLDVIRSRDFGLYVLRCSLSIRYLSRTSSYFVYHLAISSAKGAGSSPSGMPFSSVTSSI